MSFFANLGYQFRLPPLVNPDGSIILCSAMPMHQLARRNIDHRYPHMKQRLFDPQLYLAGLDAAASTRHCTVLASYPWFGVSDLDEYDSQAQTQSEWRADAESVIASMWTRTVIQDPARIREAVRKCVEFQVGLGCWAIILPSPLSVDPASDYSEELQWLDIGLSIVSDMDDLNLPVFATVAISDICLRHEEPMQNRFLDLISDVVSAREIDGVYLVLEQASEPPDARHCGSMRPLGSLLRLVHEFSQLSGLRVGVNFLGAFGLACEAAGAEFWTSGWYKSLYRLRLADRLAGGRAYPKFWTLSAATDIHLDGEFDALNARGLVQQIADVTPASNGLLTAAAGGVAVLNVPAWRYAPSNIQASMEHFLESCVSAETSHTQSTGTARRDLVENWLQNAAGFASSIAAALGPTAVTRTSHVQAWLEAYLSYRQDQSV